MTNAVPDLLSSYHERVTKETWGHDAAQEHTVKRLQRLSQELCHYSSRRNVGWWNRFRSRSNTSIPTGIYLHGGVGRGKTALMDLLYENVNSQQKCRIHFHSFMLDMHARIHSWRQGPKEHWGRGDPIKPIAEAYSKGVTFLFLDEFQVNDIADAMIIKRLFSVLFENGVVIAITSNTAPHDLYANGLNRDQFIPFIDLLESNLEIIHLSGLTDFRLLRLQRAPVYFSPLGHCTDAGLDAAFNSLTQGWASEQDLIRINGRRLSVPASACGVARFNFEQLCGEPLGTGDYVEVARRYHTVILADIPYFSAAQRDQASRFIRLIDILYEHRVNLICGAAKEPRELCASDINLSAFTRTASRLSEMRSKRYLAASHIA